MPTEFRRIVFTNAELREALSSYPGEGLVKLAAGQLRSVRFKEDAMDQIVVSLHDPLSDQIVDTVLSTSFVAAALIRYCIARRIPIQKTAQKAITLSGDNVALDLRSASRAIDVPLSKTADLKRR
jgi:hypothetical protein